MKEPKVNKFHMQPVAKQRKSPLSKYLKPSKLNLDDVIPHGSPAKESKNHSRLDMIQETKDGGGD